MKSVEKGSVLWQGKIQLLAWRSETTVPFKVFFLELVILLVVPVLLEDFRNNSLEVYYNWAIVFCIMAMTQYKTVQWHFHHAEQPKVQAVGRVVSLMKQMDTMFDV